MVGFKKRLAQLYIKFNHPDKDPSVQVFLKHFRRELVNRDLRELAITLALQIPYEVCCKLVNSTTIVLPSGKTAKPRIQCRPEPPEHLLRAQDIYANRYVSLGYVSKARSLLKRFGVPECYMTLAYFAVNGFVKL